MPADPKKKPIRLHGKKYTAFRLAVCARAGSKCEHHGCGVWIPPYDADGEFDVFTCGHVSHTKSIGSGGSDTLENARWLCFGHHNLGVHGLKFSKHR